jgi:long-chain acyl-CoA synthetase
MENFAKVLEDALAMGGTSVKNIVITQLGDLLKDGLNAKGRFINFAIRKLAKMVPAYKLPTAVWIRDAIAQGSKTPVNKPASLTRDDLAFLQYTGGTTGVSKGAMLTHGNILANCQQAHAFAEGQLTGEVETIVTLIPLYHIFSLTVNCLIFIGLGGRNILVSNPRDVKLVMMSLKGENFSGISGVNTMFA